MIKHPDQSIASVLLSSITGDRVTTLPALVAGQSAKPNDTAIIVNFRLSQNLTESDLWIEINPRMRFPLPNALVVHGDFPSINSVYLHSVHPM
jgi:hypothetical protein